MTQVKTEFPAALYIKGLKAGWGRGNSLDTIKSGFKMSQT